MRNTTNTFGDQEVEILCGRRRLAGILHIPRGVEGIVVFADGSGCGRLIPRNQFVAEVLQKAGFATLLIDLLEEKDSEDCKKVFDIPLLADRLYTAANWAFSQPELASLKLGYFGSSTGVGAALVAAARNPEMIGAVVSRGGMPELARDDLPAVHAPTLLIVGGEDDAVLELNEQAASSLRCPHKLVILPGATHLFEEPGALHAVARLATKWFDRYLAASVQSGIELSSCQSRS